jgi:golgin subfamily B member 1
LDTSKLQSECDIIALKNEIESNEQQKVFELNKMSEEKSHLEKTLNEINAKYLKDIDVDSNFIQEYSKKKTDLQSQKIGLEDEIRLLEESIIQIQELSKNLNENLIEWQNANQILEQQIIHSQSQNQQLATAIENVKSVIQNEQISQVQTENQALSAQVESLKEMIRENEYKNNQNENILKQVNSELLAQIDLQKSEYQTKIDEINSNFENSRNESEELKYVMDLENKNRIISNEEDNQANLLKASSDSDHEKVKNNLKNNLETLIDENKLLETNILQNQELNTNLNENLLEWQNANQVLEQKIVLLQEHNENLANKMNELLKNNQDLIEIESYKNEIEKLKSRIQSSEEIMNQQDYEIKQMNNDNSELLKQIDSVKNENQIRNDELNDRLTKTLEESATNLIQVEELTDQIKSLEKTVGDLNEENRNLKDLKLDEKVVQQNLVKSVDQNDLQTKKIELESTFDTLTNSIRSLESSIMENQELNQNLNANLIEWQNANQILEHQIVLLQDQNVRLNTNLNNVSTNFVNNGQEMSNELENLNIKYDSILQSKHEIENKNSGLLLELNQLESDLESKNLALKEIQEKLAETELDKQDILNKYESQLNGLQSKNQDILVEMDKLISDKDDLNRKIKLIEDQKQILQIENIDMIGEIDGLKIEKDELESQLRQMKAVNQENASSDKDYNRLLKEFNEFKSVQQNELRSYMDDFKSLQNSNLDLLNEFDQLKVEKDDLLNQLNQLNIKFFNINNLLEETKESKEYFENQVNNLNNEISCLNDTIFQLQNLFPGKSKIIRLILLKLNNFYELNLSF